MSDMCGHGEFHGHHGHGACCCQPGGFDELLSAGTSHLGKSGLPGWRST
ncbi:MAG: hypothetical protein U9Q17_02280 [Chloroflexota bacterium]|nr:hypothetical protein [Chloroflexota bacterium]